MKRIALHSRALYMLVFLISIGISLGTACSAQAQQSALAQSFQGDTTKGKLVAGALVSSKTDSTRTVELATTDTADRIVGVIGSNPLVTISESNQKVNVVLSGSTTILVSDINGTIKNGDRITASPIAGVGMLATADSQIVGTAQNDFKQTSTQAIKDLKGKAHEIALGSVQLQVGITYYHAPASNFLPPFMQQLANSIAGRPVSLIRILTCSVLLLLSFGTVAIMVSTSIRSSMTAIGRNPLAARAIRGGLYQVIATAVAVVAATLTASYLILSV